MNKYLLIGPSGVGKSTALEKLSQKGCYDTFDLETIISEITGKDVTQYIAEVGSADFFLKSKEIIENLRSDRDIVIAVGAGSFVHPEGHSWFLKQNTITLTGDSKHIYERSNRQMFHPEYNGYHATEFSTARQKLYNNSKYKIDVTGLNADKVFEIILEILDNAD